MDPISPNVECKITIFYLHGVYGQSKISLISFLIIDEDEVLLYLFFVTGCASIGKIGSTEIFRISNVAFVNLQENSECDSRISDVHKLLMSGSFYFTHHAEDCDDVFDLSLSAQRSKLMSDFDGRFFW